MDEYKDVASKIAYEMNKIERSLSYQDKGGYTYEVLSENCDLNKISVIEYLTENKGYHSGFRTLVTIEKDPREYITGRIGNANGLDCLINESYGYKSPKEIIEEEMRAYNQEIGKNYEERIVKKLRQLIIEDDWI
jgi:hypothetical protein